MNKNITVTLNTSEGSYSSKRAVPRSNKRYEKVEKVSASGPGLTSNTALFQALGKTANPACSAISPTHAFWPSLALTKIRIHIAPLSKVVDTMGVLNQKRMQKNTLKGYFMFFGFVIKKFQKISKSIEKMSFRSSTTGSPINLLHQAPHCELK